MEIFNKISAITKSTVDKTSNKMNISKINGRINTLRSAIRAQQQKIGEYYWERFKDNETYEDGIADVFAEVKNLSSQVALAEAEINAILESERSAEAAPVSSNPLSPVRECPSCGAPNDTNSKFCSACGGSMAVLPDNECAKCGAAMGEGDKFCVNCGAKA